MASDQRLAEISREQVKRRGLMAGLAALVAGLLGKATERVAEATHGGGVDPQALHVDQVNIGSFVTELRSTAAPALKAFSSSGVGFHGLGVAGIFGQATTGDAVFASSASGVGVRVQSGPSDAIVATANNGSSPAGRAITATSTNNEAIRCQSNSSVNAALVSVSSGAFAVHGFTDTGVGIRGEASTPSGLAGQFVGGVLIAGNLLVGGVGTVNSDLNVSGSEIVNGNLSVVGNLAVAGTKSAAVPDTGGGYRLVFCVEAPESWFQDFGSAQLSGGRAVIALRPDFASAVLTGGHEYHVFLTEYGNTNSGLYVSQRGPTSFEVRAANDKDPTVFGYMVVAKRRDVPETRMPQVARERLFPAPPPAPVAPKDPPRPRIEPVPGRLDGPSLTPRR